MAAEEALALVGLAERIDHFPAQLSTAEERAYCERMVAEMGADTPHEHAEMKGLPTSGMSVSHERCRLVLAGK
jgi:hypothetical protein